MGDLHSSGSVSVTAPRPFLEQGSYLLVALGAVSAALLVPGHVVGDGVDLYGTFWFYWWIGDCLVHLRDPSFTDLMFYPLGKDIFAHTGDNFVDALASWPLQVLVGFPRYQPWFVALILWVNALAFRPLARHLLGRSHAAWGATLLWQVCPYVLFELMTGRLTQAFLWFLPPAVLAFLRIGEDPAWRSARAPVLAGAFTGLLAWTYWFYGYFVLLGYAWLAGVALVRGLVPRRRLLAGYLLAGAVCLLGVGPGLLLMVQRHDAGAVPGLGQHGGGLFDLPTQLGNNVAAQLHGYVLMERSGQPMFAYLVWGGGLLAWALFGRERLRLGGVAALAFAFAVGTVWPDEKGGGLLMPHYLLAYHVLPFFDRLWFPYRLVVMAFLPVTLGIGTVLARLEGRLAARWRRAPLAVALVPVLLSIGEQHRHLAYPLLHRDMQPPRVYSVLGELGGALFELPVGIARVSIAWQPVHRQPTFGGMAENAQVFWPAGYRQRLDNSFVRMLRQLTRSPDKPRDFDESDCAALEGEGFRWVVLDRHLVDADMHRWAFARHATAEEVDRAPFTVQEHLVEVLGEPVAVEGPLVVWDLRGGAVFPEELHPTPEALSRRTWATDDMPEYETHLRELGRLRDH